MNSAGVTFSARHRTLLQSRWHTTITQLHVNTHCFRTGVEKGMKLFTAVQEGCGYKDTLRASLLCSVGKIFHCVHYLSAGLRMFKYLQITSSRCSPIVFVYSAIVSVYFTAQRWQFGLQASCLLHSYGPCTVVMVWDTPFSPNAAYWISPLPISLTFSPPNAPPCLQANLMRRTNGHCLWIFKLVHFLWLLWNK